MVGDVDGLVIEDKGTGQTPAGCACYLQATTTARRRIGCAV